MNTGTPLDLTPFGALLKGVGNLYWILLAVGVGLVIWKAKTLSGKLLGSSLVIAVIAGPVAWHLMQLSREQAIAKERLDAATKLFEERCKTAGEKVHGTANGVDGVLLLKVRSDIVNLSDQYRMDDPYGADCHGMECVVDLLRVSQGAEFNPELAIAKATGFLYVDVIDPDKNIRKRYRGVIEQRFSHRVTAQDYPLDNRMPKYGVRWEDISTPADRSHWIAGGALQVIDLANSTVLAERRGYMLDRGQGDRAGGRSPWGFAYDDACPRFPTSADGRAIRVGHSRKFILNALNP